MKGMRYWLPSAIIAVLIALFLLFLLPDGETLLRVATLVFVGVFAIQAVNHWTMINGPWKIEGKLKALEDRRKGKEKKENPPTD